MSTATGNKLVELLNRSRYLLVAFLVHGVLILALMSIVVFTAPLLQKEFAASVLISGDGMDAAPPPPPPAPTQDQKFDVQIQQSANVTMREIISVAGPSTSFSVPQFIPDLPKVNLTQQNAAAPQMKPQDMARQQTRTVEQVKQIKSFTQNWVKTGTGGSGPKGLTAEFSVFVGRPASSIGETTGKGAQSTDWKGFMMTPMEAAKQTETDNETIFHGAVPNLGEMISLFSKGKIKAQSKAVPMRLDNSEIFDKKPPFVFITGRNDFSLNEAEVQNLRKYLIVGGCIWGDAMVPGKGSRFDIAFRREMKKVIPDEDKPWEVIPNSHDIFQKGFTPQRAGVPPGLNFFQEPIETIKIDDVEAIIYTLNGYGAMWNVMLDPKKQFTDFDMDVMTQFSKSSFLGRTADLYRNLTPASVKATYDLGINIVTYLLLRFEAKLRTVST